MCPYTLVENDGKRGEYIAAKSKYKTFSKA